MTEADVAARVDDLLGLIRQAIHPLHLDDRLAVLLRLSARLPELNDDTGEIVTDVFRPETGHPVA